MRLLRRLHHARPVLGPHLHGRLAVEVFVGLSEPEQDVPRGRLLAERPEDGCHLGIRLTARVDLEAPRNLVIVSSVLVMGIGGLALNFDGLTLQGVSLCAVVAVLLNLILPKARAGA